MHIFLSAIIEIYVISLYIFNYSGRGFTKMSSQGQYEGGGTKTVSMFSKLVSQGSSFVMEGVKNLVVKKHVSLPSIKLLSLLCLAS